MTLEITDISRYFFFSREFLMAINITGELKNSFVSNWTKVNELISILAKGNPEKKLKWAFKMYDIDSNGSIDRQEMLKIIEVKPFELMKKERSNSIWIFSSRFMIYLVLEHKMHRMAPFQPAILMIHLKVEQHKSLLWWWVIIRIRMKSNFHRFSFFLLGRRQKWVRWN